MILANKIKFIRSIFLFLKKLGEQEIREIFHSFSAIERTVFLENFAAIFDSLLYSFSKSLGRFGGEFLLPKELSLFVSNLVELDSGAKVYNPFCWSSFIWIILR